MSTTDEKLDELEKLLLDAILEKARLKEPLTTGEMTLVIKWSQTKRKAPNKPVEPIITHGAPLPFLSERLPFREAVEALEEVL